MSQGKIDLKIQLSSFFDRSFTLDQQGTPVFNLFTEGRWRQSKSGMTFDVKTPVNGDLVAKVTVATKEEVLETIKAAHENRYKIREVPAIERIELFEEAEKLIQEYRGDFVRTLVVGSGKTVVDAEGEVGATLGRMRLTMEDARKIFGEYIPGDWADDTLGKFALVLREPIGVVAAISPFNHPLFLTVCKIVPALLSGNAVVVKPPSSNPIVSLLYARVLEEAGMPEGSLHILTGNGSEIGDTLVSDDRIGMVSFTGSTAVGKHITTITGIKRCHLELGGKGAAIILEDTDIELAADRCVQGSFKNAGQRCDAISIVFVMDGIADKFVEKILQRVDKWKLGDPRDPSVDMGPVIDLKAAEHIQDLVDDAVAKGAKLLRGGTHQNCFYEPTVLDRVPPTAKIKREETFGPVVTIVRVKDEDEALEIANESRYGLDSCVFTNNFYKIWKMAKKLHTGGVTVNDFPRHGVGFFPFGGWKESGEGREGIGYTIEEMTYLKTITFNIEPAGLGKVKHIHRM